ncbi:MAG: YncE family protein [Leptospirales bacterium]
MKTLKTCAKQTLRNSVFLFTCSILFVCFLHAGEPDKWRIYLQPWEPVTAFIDGKKVESISKHIEKNLGYVDIILPEKIRNRSFYLKIVSEGVLFDKKINLTGFYRDILFQKIDKTYQPVGYINTGKKPKSARFMNNHIVIVPLLDASGISIIDIKTGKRKLLPVPEKYIGESGFVESLVIPDTKELWITQMTSSIHVFDLKTFKYKTTITVSGNWTKFMEYDKSRKRVYVSNWLSGDVSVIDIKRKKQIDTLQTGGIPRGLLLSSDSKALYVTLYSGNKSDTIRGNLLRIDLESKKNTKIDGKPGAKRHLVRDNKGRIYVSDMLNAIVEVIDEKSLKLIKTIPVYDKPNTIVVSPDGTTLFVSCRGPNNKKSYLLKGPKFGKIIMIDLKRLEVVREVEGGNQPTGLDISPDGKILVLTDFLDHKLRFYNLQNM